MPDAEVAMETGEPKDIPEIRVDPAEPLTSSSAQGGSTAKAGAEKTRDEDVEEKKELPFQLQIRYTDTEGAKALRVITQTKPVTRDRKKAEKCKSVFLLPVDLKNTILELLYY